jgi:SAM-dependent methyltransferase
MSAVAPANWPSRWPAGSRAVVGLDVSGEMLAEAERQAALAGVTTIDWLEVAGEAITPALGHFRLVTIGSALHWMRRDEVLAHCRTVLEPGGALAIFNSGSSIWFGTLAWQQAVVAVVQRWLGPERRAGQGTFADPLEPYHDPGPRPSPASDHRAARAHTWTVATITACCMRPRTAGATTSATGRRPSRPTGSRRCWRLSQPRPIRAGDRLQLPAWLARLKLVRA